MTANFASQVSSRLAAAEFSRVREKLWSFVEAEGCDQVGRRRYLALTVSRLQSDNGRSRISFDLTRARCRPVPAFHRSTRDVRFTWLVLRIIASRNVIDRPAAAN